MSLRPGLVAAALLGLLGGCTDIPDTIELSTVSIIADPGANAGNAVAVDLVLLLEPGLETQVLALPAREWFKKREQIRRDHPDTVLVRSWELVPGQSVPDVAIDSPRSPNAAVVFADYAAPGDHRLRIGEEDDSVDILLQASGVMVRPVPAK